MNQQEHVLKFLRRYFQSQNFENGGFVFEFVQVDIEKDFDAAFRFLVNVVLPNPNQSFIVEVFDDMVQNIIRGAYDFLGEVFSYSLTITIDGKELFPETYAYVRPESLDKILQENNANFSQIGISVNFGEGDIPMTMDCELSWRRIPYDGHDDNLNVYFNLHLSNFTLGGKEVVPNPEKLDIVAGTLHSILADRDWFTPVIEESIYEECSEEMGLNLVEDVYVQVFFRINQLNGRKVKQRDEYYKIKPDDFIEVS